MITESYAAGTVSAAFLELLPAATTKVTPRLLAAQIAACSASPLPAGLGQLAPSVTTLGPWMLMLATSIGLEPTGCWPSMRVLATQSTPQATVSVSPTMLPFWLAKMRTAKSCTPGATPTMPPPGFSAAIVPETCVPWPSFMSTSAHALWPVLPIRESLAQSMPLDATSSSASGWT